MAGSVLNSSSVFQLKFSAKLNISASISATSPSCKTLAVIIQKIHESNTISKELYRSTLNHSKQ